MTISITATATYAGHAYEWDVREDDLRIGKILRDSEGTWYAQAPNADFQRFEDGTEAQNERAAIGWLQTRA